MQDIPLQADVTCQDGPAGRSTAVIVDPKTLQVTHFAVREEDPPQTQRIVPIEQVAETTLDSIRLRCTKAELARMPAFTDVEYCQVEVPTYVGTDLGSPMLYPEIMTVPVEHERVPEGEFAVHAGDRVEASDGPVGWVDELVTDPASGQITHLVLRQGHLWGQKDVMLPVSVVRSMAHGTIYLTLDQQTISAYLAIPARWRSGVGESELVIALFPEPRKASQVLQALKGLAKEGKLAFVNAAVLVKDDEGRTSLSESGDVGRGRGALFGAITGGLIGMLGGPVGAIVGAAAGAATGRAAAGRVDMGFPDEYLKQLQAGLQAGSSALVTLVERAWIEPLLQALAGFEGRVMRQALTDDVLAHLTQGKQT